MRTSTTLALATPPVTIDWGDGSDADRRSTPSTAAGEPCSPGHRPTATTPGQITIGHIYSDILPHTVTVTVTDNGGLSAQASRVYAPRPQITTFTPPTPTEGSTFSGTVATFTDPGHAITDFAATILWGDGAFSTVTSATGGIVQNGDGSFTVLASHLYAEEATGLTFQVQVTDTTNGNEDSKNALINVLDAPVTATATPVHVFEHVPSMARWPRCRCQPVR